jgi:hypothetical protein
MSDTNLTSNLIIPMGTALDIADKAQNVADDARKLADHPNEVLAEDLLTTMRLLYQGLSAAFKDLGVDSEMSEEIEFALPINSTQSALVALRQRIIDSGDLAGCLAIEMHRRRSLETAMLRLTKLVDDLANRIP